MAGPLHSTFDRPSAAFAPVPLWWWSGEPLDEARLRWQLRRLAEGGVGAVVIINIAPSGPLFGCDADDPPFQSERWWELLEAVCEEADALGVRLWLYDQLGFSGANLQGGLVAREPAFEGRALRWRSVAVDGPARPRAAAGAELLAAFALPLPSGEEVSWPEPAGQDQARTLDPVALPLDGGAAVWDGTGPHRLVLFESVREGFDWLDPAACAALIDRVHGEAERRLGARIGTTIAGTFQDELPALPSWSARFAEEFGRRRGYDLLPELIHLVADCGPRGAQVRRDYQAVRAALAEEAFFRPLHAWHEARGLLVGCDQLDAARAGYPLDAADLYADYQRTHRWFSAPGADHHGDMRIHASLAQLHERPRVWLEAFHSSGWGGTIEETFDWLLPFLRAGATLYDPHATYYSTRGGWWEWAPPSTDWRQPYWHHNRVFADAIARLCGVLSAGRHVCDVAVLHPAATVQAGLLLDGTALDAARAADETYRAIVGDMTWFAPQGGALDADRRDFDVLDEDSLQRATADGGVLGAGGGARYRAVVLPAAVELEEATAAALAAFARGGGLVVAVGARPALLDAEDCVLVADAGGLAAALRDVPRTVEAGVPTLRREVDGQTVVFVPATSSRASEVQPVGAGGRGMTLGWLDVTIDFDPERYDAQARVRVRDVRGRPELWEPFSGRRRPLPFRRDGDDMELVVPFEDGPGVLVAFVEDEGADASAPRAEAAPGGLASPAASAPAAAHPAPAADPSAPPRALALPDVWDAEVLPLIADPYGDLRRPPAETLPLQRWEVEHRAEPDGAWEPAVATFGPGAEACGPAPAVLLPDPAAGDADAIEREARIAWRPLAWSASRGVHKDPVHRATLGPKGHVPEEFLLLGPVAAGDAVQLRCDVEVPADMDVQLALGAPGAKRAWLDGVPVLADRPGYRALAPLRLIAGTHRLVVRIEAGQTLPQLRASLCFVADPARFAHPEWLEPEGSPVPGATVAFRRALACEHAPEHAPAIVFAQGRVRVRVNGETLLDNVPTGVLAHYPVPFPRTLDLAPALRGGENVVEVEVEEGAAPATILVDAELQEGALMSDAGWSAARDGEPCGVRLRRGHVLEPGGTTLRRRPHPLPGAAWLEDPADRAAWDGVVVPLRLVRPGAAERGPASLRFDVPPGATALRCAVHGAVSVELDGEPLAALPASDGGASTRVDVALPRPDATGRVCTLRVSDAGGREQGALLDGPIAFELGPGRMPLGDWEAHGLRGFSGGVRYRAAVELDRDAAPARAVLDLGRVRGTAEVRVNGAPAGVRVLSPYRFEVGPHLRSGHNEIDVTVLNTLGPHMDATSPTHFVFPGQRASGLLGPVRLLAWDPSTETRNDQ